MIMNLGNRSPIESGAQRGVVMSLDDTLFDAGPLYDRLFAHVASEVSARCGGDAEAYVSLLEKVADELTRDHPELPEAFRTRADLPKSARFAVAQAFRSFDPGELSLHTDVEEFLESTRAPVAIVTHGDRLFDRLKIRALRLAHRVDLIVVAADCGEAWRAPSVLPYRAVCRAFQLSPEEILCVGSNPFTDFEGAYALGMKCRRIARGTFATQADLPWLAPMDTTVSVESLEALLEAGGLVSIDR